jgi:hypothetical protein
MGRRAAATHGLAFAGEAEGLTLDAGALIALDRANDAVLALVDRAEQLGRPIGIPAAALAQAWRASRRQHRLALLLDGRSVDVPALDAIQALAVGALLGRTGTSDVVDATVVITARQRGQWVVTSDADDLRRLDPDLPIIEV